MKKLYFFTMLSIMLLAVTGATAQKKTKFKVADLKVFGSSAIMYPSLPMFRER